MLPLLPIFMYPSKAYQVHMFFMFPCLECIEWYWCKALELHYKALVIQNLCCFEMQTNLANKYFELSLKAFAIHNVKMWILLLFVFVALNKTNIYVLYQTPPKCWNIEKLCYCTKKESTNILCFHLFVSI